MQNQTKTPVYSLFKSIRQHQIIKSIRQHQITKSIRQHQIIPSIRQHQFIPSIRQHQIISSIPLFTKWKLHSLLHCNGSFTAYSINKVKGLVLLYFFLNWLDGWLDGGSWFLLHLYESQNFLISHN